MTRFAAVLLFGPTGSGKTPLGHCMEARGLWGRRCAHFDVGENLRAVASAREDCAGLSESDLGVVQDALRSGALLENENFHIVQTLFASFARRKGLAEDDFVVLNGIPRHLGQARDVEALVDVRAVIHLECTPQVVRERIRLNPGGDREGRADDGAAAVERRIRLFHERTLPLLEHYLAARKPILNLTVGERTEASELWRLLDAWRE